MRKIWTSLRSEWGAKGMMGEVEWGLCLKPPLQAPLTTRDLCENAGSENQAAPILQIHTQALSREVINPPRPGSRHS